MIQSISVETTLPQAERHRYTDALKQALKLTPGEYLKLEFENKKQANSAKISLYLSIRRYNHPVKALLRGTSVYIGQEPQS